MSSHHAPPPHLAPGPAPLRTPVGGGAHGCARGSRGRPLAGSPTPVAVETGVGGASYAGEGERGEKRTEWSSAGNAGKPRTRGSSRVSPHSHAPASVSLLRFSSLFGIPWQAAAGRILSKVTSPLLPATPLCVTSGKGGDSEVTNFRSACGWPNWLPRKEVYGRKFSVPGGFTRGRH